MHAVKIDDLRRLMERADLLLQKALAAMPTHWNEAKQGFHANAEARAKGPINLSTTCFGLFAMLREPELLGKLCAKPGKKVEANALNGIITAMLDTTWKSEDLKEFNIYTTPIVINTLYQVMADPIHGASVRAICASPGKGKKIGEGLEHLLKATDKTKAGSFPPYEPNAYLTFWCFEATRREAVQTLFGGALADRCKTRAMELADWGEAELYRQLSYHASRDLARFDPIQLAYALRIYTDRQAWVKQTINRKLLTKAIEVIFGQQNEDGLWPKSRPIFHFSTRGSVYPFTYEMVDVLIPSSPQRSMFEPHMGKLEASLRWAEENYIDGPAEKGWRTSHLPFGDNPEGWSTAAVLISVRKIRSAISAQINEDILDDFRAQRYAASDDSPLHPDNFYDADIPGHRDLTLKAVLTKYLVAPHQPGGSEVDRRYSAVFYGPPGTAKTTMATAVAKCLGWPYLYLQTSNFAGEGVNQIIGKARDIFDRLSLLERAVVLIDEVEEFVRDRKSETQPSSRLLTTSMLSLIQDLRSKQRIIFIVATNFLDKFDAAITRTGGRFDMMLLISPPSCDEKLRLFRARLAKRKLPPDEEVAIVKAFEPYFKDRFPDRIAFYAFTEWKVTSDTLIDDLLAKKKVDEKALDSILKETFETIALSDEDLRRAYLASKKYVRL